MTSLSNKTFFYERYQKNSFRFGFSAHKMYNKIFISKFFEAINFSASVVWRPKLWRLRGFLFFELEQFRDQILNPWEILHNPSYPYNQISEFFLKGPTLLVNRVEHRDISFVFDMRTGCKVNFCCNFCDLVVAGSMGEFLFLTYPMTTQRLI